MESFNFGAFDTNLGARIAAIPQEAQKQQTANMLQAMQMQGVMNQNELAQSQIRTARRAEEGQTLLGKAYGGLDFSGASTGGVPGQSPLAAIKSQVIKSLTASNRPDLIPGELAKINEMEHKETINKELIGKINQQKIVAQNSEADRYKKALVNVSNYDSAEYWLRHQYDNAVLKDIISIVPFETALAEIPKDPVGLADWKNKNALGLEKYIEQNKPNITTRNTGTTTELLSTPGLGGAATVVPGSQATIQISPNTTATLKQQQDHFNSLSAFQKRQLADAGWTFDSDRGIAVNAKRGISQPISTLMTPVSGGNVPAVGGAPAQSIALGGGVPGQRQAPAGQPVAGVLGPKPEKPSTEYLKTATGIVNTNYAINNLKQLTNNFTAADMLNPARRAEIEAAHSTAILLAKDMFGLGVLNEGDEKILRKIIPDATAFSKGLVPIETIRKNLLSATNVINRMNETSAKIHKQPLLSLDAGTPNAPSPSAPPIQSFRPSSQGRP